MMRVSILLGNDSNMMPRQFLQSPKSPFFGSFTRCPFFQSAGTLPSAQIFCIRGSNMVSVVEESVFSASGGISSGPGALLFFSAFRAFWISAFVGGLVLTLSGVSAGGISGLSEG
ncbi:hypothetical protein DPMN_054355 [Dreissena polymorpha]|uniref:Uncharacterized protein n=1 Tax=Dreissena polymorpha TaxID=45954 RepID=A0A9D4CPH0_DREPO|nr:hypothetical protein DPMN_054355 [Dreissena polymorpha]